MYSSKRQACRRISACRCVQQRIQVDPASVSIVRYTEARPYVLGTNTHAGDLTWLTPPRRTRSRRRADAEVGGGAGPDTPPAAQTGRS